MVYFRRRSYGRRIPARSFSSSSYAKGVRAGIAKARGGRTWARPRYSRRY